MPTPGKKTTGLEPHPCVVYLLTLSLANYILLSLVCWVALKGLSCGFTLEACHALPAVLVVYLLFLSLANYVLLSHTCLLDSTQELPCGFTLEEEGGGDYISEQRTISDCESAAHIGKTGWEKRRARRNDCSDA